MNAPQNPTLQALADSEEVRACDQINELIKLCLDGQDLYQSTAERCSCDVLRGRLMEKSHQRAGFVAALQTLQRKHGHLELEEGNSLGAMARLAWAELTSVFRTVSDQDILDEINHEEFRIIDRYREILRDFRADLYPEEAVVIGFQLRHISRDRETLRHFKKTEAAA